MKDESKKMETTCQDLEFIQNREIVAAVNAETRSLGLLLICTGCDDVEATVEAFLVSEAKKEAWALCGSCARQMSQFSAVISDYSS